MTDINRVLLLTPSLEHAGPAYNALTLARALGKMDVSVMTVALCGGERENAFAALNLEYRVEPRLKNWLRGRTARRELYRYAPDIIHVQDISVLPVGVRLARKISAPLVATINSIVRDDDETYLHIPGVNYVAVSDAVFNNLVQARKLPRTAVHVIHNGIDLERYTIPGCTESVPGTSAPRQGERIAVVGTLGSLRQEKGQGTFLRAAREVMTKRGDVEFLVIGRGPDLPALRKLASELGVNKRVTFSTGATFASSTSDLSVSKLESLFLREFDIFVEPSTNEGLGLSVMQAMAWGRPVVATGVGGLYSLVEDNVTGLLVPKEDAQSMAAAIMRLLDKPDTAAEMGRHGRERIEAEFSSSLVAGQHLELYRKLAEDFSR